MYDVIIVGAGPTGSCAAKTLADKGYKILLVEKMSMPREKSCSGVLIKKSIDLVERYFGEAVPFDVQCMPNDNRGMIFTNDIGKEYRFEQSGLNIWRSKFDYWLAMKAKASGADVIDKTAVLSCVEKNDGVEVVLKDERVYSEYARTVIVCDGAVGSVKRKLTNASKKYITTFQSFCKGSINLDYHYFYAYLQREFSQYDAWFNVKDDYLIFGVSVKESNKVQMYHERFISYMTEKHKLCLTDTVRSERWIMPHIMPNCPIEYGKGRILFAGETAGFLNPMGEGISCGMESGYAAAMSVCEELSSGDDFNADNLLKRYEKNVLDTRTYMHRQWHFVSEISSTFSHMKMQRS